MLIVNKDNVVETRRVEIGQAVGDLRVIDSGLKPDDRVVVVGLMRAIPGQKVDPQMQVAKAPDPGTSGDVSNGKAPDPKTTGAQAADPKAMDSKAAESKTMPSKAADAMDSKGKSSPDSNSAK